ncbi:MAG: hypothetical protein IPM39_17725 [Chloroflexi bacterium]|nr:hypothetical protein [Chloroflexota bacterium]
MNEPHLTLRQLSVWLILALTLITLPYVWVAATTPPGQVFTATLINPDDTSVYLSAIRQGREGQWLFAFQFSPEAIGPKFMYSFYLLLGHLSARLGGEALLWFHGARLLSSLFMLLALLAWVRAALPGQPRWQATAWFLAVFGGGLGWLAAITGAPLKQIPELGVSEWGVMMPLMATPHFALGLGLVILYQACLLSAARSGQKRFWGATAVCGCLTGLTYPYMVPALGLITGVYLLVLAGQRRLPFWKLFLGGATVLGPMIPFVFYYGFWAYRDALWALTHVQDNVVPPPSILGLALSLALIGPMALIGAWRWWRDKREILVLVWAVVQIAMLALPVSYSGRFLLALVVPLGTLAAYGLEQVILPWLWQRGSPSFWSRLSSTPYDTIRRLILILTLPSTLLAALFLTQAAAVRPDYPLFLPEADAQAVGWLAAHTSTDDLVLAHYPVGNYLPGQAPARVFLGQSYLTLDMAEKLALVETFWQPETTAVWREQFLAEWGITLVYAGIYEQALAETAVIPPGRLVYDEAGVRIYDVQQ